MEWSRLNIILSASQCTIQKTILIKEITLNVLLVFNSNIDILDKNA